MYFFSFLLFSVCMFFCVFCFPRIVLMCVLLSPLPCYVVKLNFFLAFFFFVSLKQISVSICAQGDDPLSHSGHIFLCERYPETHLMPSSMVKKQQIYNSVREADGQTTEDSDTETERNGTLLKMIESEPLRRAEQIRH